MLSVDLSKAPVVIGAGQFTNRDEDPASAPNPFELMEQAVLLASRSASSGSDGRSALQGITHLFMVHSLSLRHGDPSAALAEHLGLDAVDARCSGMGGNIPQWLMDRACEMIVNGKRPVVLIAGAEALATRKRAKVGEVKLDWPSASGWPNTWPPLEPDLGVHPIERAHGLEQATTMYALVETAIAHAKGFDSAERDKAIGALMERFNRVAVENPFSWFAQSRSAEEIMNVHAGNRLIFYPYPKYVNAVMDVDMAAAVIITDAQTAREMGCAPEDVAYVRGWADAHDIWYLSQRPRIQDSPALGSCASAALEIAGMSVGDVDAFDLYSCFPSSIEVARDSFGIDSSDERPLTLTGGLPYHGGPGSNYVTHAIANAFEATRSSQARNVLVHGNGYYLTKHSVGIYSKDPPTQDIDISGLGELQKQIDGAAEVMPIEQKPSGNAVISAYTVSFERSGEPAGAVVLADIEGSRTVARADGDLIETLLNEDAVGLAISLTTTDSGNIAF